MTDSHILEKIHELSLKVLAELGIRTDHALIKELLRRLGCKVEGDQIKIPPELVSQALAAVPRRFWLYGRAGDKSLPVDVNGPTLYTNTGILPNIYDFEGGAIRRSLRQDVELTTRMLDALSEVDLVYVSLMDATEVPAHMITVTDFAVTLANTTKPLVGPGIINKAEANAIINLASTLYNGDWNKLAERPPCAPFAGSISPLRIPKDSVDALIEIVSAGLPLMALTNPVAGITAPYTIAGCVALGHAEVLAMIVMANAIRTGAPVLSFNTPTIADMRTLASTTGGPETGLMRGLAVEVAQHVGIPTFAHGHTSSTHLDLQASDEKSINALIIAQSRPSVMGGLGGLANVTLTSYETMVMDNERFGAIRRAMRGVDADDAHLGYEVIAGMVQGMDVISHPHTLHFLRSEVWRPKLARRQGLVNGQPDNTTALERARLEARRILDGHSVDALPPVIQANIDAVLEEYDAQYTG